MKKIIVLMFVLSGVGMLVAKTDQEVLKAVVSNHTRALDRKNMYEKSLDDADVNNWKSAIDEVGKFVERNSKKNRKQLLGYYKEIVRANTDLINRIKDVYQNILDGLYDEYEKIWFDKIFKAIDADMKRIQKNLDWIATKSGPETKAIKLVRNLAQFISATARKASSNLDSIVK